MLTDHFYSRLNSFFSDAAKPDRLKLILSPDMQDKRPGKKPEQSPPTNYARFFYAELDIFW